MHAIWKATITGIKTVLIKNLSNIFKNAMEQCYVKIQWVFVSMASTETFSLIGHNRGITLKIQIAKKSWRNVRGNFYETY